MFSKQDSIKQDIWSISCGFMTNLYNVVQCYSIKSKKRHYKCFKVKFKELRMSNESQNQNLTINKHLDLKQWLYAFGKFKKLTFRSVRHFFKFGKDTVEWYPQASLHHISTSEFVCGSNGSPSLKYPITPTLDMRWDFTPV